MATDRVGEWVEAAVAGDADAAGRTLTEDCTLVSPLTDAFTFTGRGEITDLLRSVFEVITEVSLRRRIDDGDTVVLVMSARCRGRNLGETQVITVDAEGRIARVELFLRPLPAVTGLLRELGNRVPKRQGRPVVSGVLTVAGALLDTVAVSGDTVFLPMAAPESTRGPRRPR